MPDTVAISGNTYPVKDVLKSMGAKWDPDKRVWMIAEDKADQARKIVTAENSASPKTKNNDHDHNHYSICHDCGAASRGYYYCYDCSLEHRDGGAKAHNGMSYHDRNGRFVLGDDD